MNNLALVLRAYKSDVEIHKHAAYQIVFSEDNPFHSTIENELHQHIYGFVIEPHVIHSCQSSNSNVIVINVEVHSLLGNYLSKKLEGSASIIFSAKAELETFFNISATDFSIHKVLLTNQLGNSIQGFDERIQKSLSYIHENFQSEKFSINDLAEHVYLSPSRLSALFKEQIGSSITKYLLWTRLRKAIFLTLSEKDKPLTAIAFETGFYDSSQMNKYMYEMFGIAPSRLRQKSDLVQFLETALI